MSLANRWNSAKLWSAQIFPITGLPDESMPRKRRTACACIPANSRKEENTGLNRPDGAVPNRATCVSRDDPRSLHLTGYETSGFNCETWSAYMKATPAQSCVGVASIERVRIQTVRLCLRQLMPAKATRPNAQTVKLPGSGTPFGGGVWSTAVNNKIGESMFVCGVKLGFA